MLMFHKNYSFSPLSPSACSLTVGVGTCLHARGPVVRVSLPINESINRLKPEFWFSLPASQLKHLALQ